jgi:hypothetical protein
MMGRMAPQAQKTPSEKGNGAARLIFGGVAPLILMIAYFAIAAPNLLTAGIMVGNSQATPSNGTAATAPAAPPVPDSQDPR